MRKLHAFNKDSVTPVGENDLVDEGLSSWRESYLMRNQVTVTLADGLPANVVSPHASVSKNVMAVMKATTQFELDHAATYLVPAARGGLANRQAFEPRVVKRLAVV